MKMPDPILNDELYNSSTINDNYNGKVVLDQIQIGLCVLSDEPLESSGNFLLLEDGYNLLLEDVGSLELEL